MRNQVIIVALAQEALSCIDAGWYLVGGYVSQREILFSIYMRGTETYQIGRCCRQAEGWQQLLE